MSTTTVQKKENLERPYLQLVRPERPERSPEQLLDLELTETVAALEVGAGQQRPRRLYKIADGELFPVRVLARVITDALAALADPCAVFLAVCGPIQRFIERRARRKTSPQLPRRCEFKRLPSGPGASA